MVPAGMTSHQRRHRSCTPRRDHKAVVTSAIVLWAVCALVCSEDSVEAGNEVHVVEDVDAWDTSKTLVVNELGTVRAPSADDALVGYSWAARLIEMELQGNETDSLYPFDSPCLEWSNDSFLQLIIDVTISFQGEGTLDILDEEFRYDHDASINSCKGDMEGQLATGCWPLGRLLLHPEEHENAAALLAAGEMEQLQDAISNLISVIDSGVDADGEATGGAGDGTIEWAELANRVYAVLRTWQYEEDRLWMDAVDADTDGLITFSEASSDVSSMGASNSAALAAILARFNFADSKKDGWLSETDVGAFRNPLWFDRMHQWVLGVILRELGVDSDAYVSRAEYTRVDGPHMPFCWEVRVPTYVKEREFERLDRDGSGSLGLDEARLMPDVRLASIITHGVAALVHACDADGDGVLSADEIVAQAAVFASARGLPTRSRSAEDGDDVHDEL